MDNLSDDDYDHLSDVEMARSGSERQQIGPDSAPSSPPSISDLRASDRKTLACPYGDCPKTFNRKARLEEHIRSHKNIRLFKCPRSGCDKDFLRQSHLNHHVKSAHSDVRDYACTWEGCGKSFATGTRLRRHLSAHEGREKYRCRGYEGCNETFRKHETLRKHVLLVHEQTKPFPCEDIDAKTGQTCSKSFETAEKLDRHKRSQHDIMRFSCTDCLISPTAKGGSRTTQEDEYFPTMASLSGFFATYSELQAHIAEAHPPTCEHCSSIFKTSKELTRHLEVQHGYIDSSVPSASTIACTYFGCNRSFTKKGNLMVHIKTVHENQRDFVCGVTNIPVPEEIQEPGAPIQGCGRGFSTKASLQDHVRTAHFGLQSKVVESRQKRKADQSTEDDVAGILPELKKRAPRKDRGIPKKSAFAALTGMSAAPVDDGQQLHNVLVDSEYDLSKAHAEGAHNAKDEDSEEEDPDEWNQMTGSMTLCDDKVYHNGRSYHYTDGQYPPGLPSPEISTEMQQRMRSDSVGNDYQQISHFEDDGIFANFEHEPEHLYGPIDPVLLRSQA